MTRVKICGITSREDARAAVDAGADALGLVFADSPRRVTLERAVRIVGGLPPLVSVVGVFVDAPEQEITRVSEAVRLDLVQLHGQESPELCAALGRRVIKRFNVFENDTPEHLRERMERYRVAGYLLDPGAGSGQSFDWSLAGGLPGPLIVSGGLTPVNVGSAIRAARPLGVDVCSGVECEPGRKDPAKLRAFVQAVRSADASIREG